MALVAYEQPEQSPLQHLLEVQQREHVADVVNTAVLQLQEEEGKQGSRTGAAQVGHPAGQHAPTWKACCVCPSRLLPQHAQALLTSSGQPCADVPCLSSHPGVRVCALGMHVCQHWPLLLYGLSN